MTYIASSFDSNNPEIISVIDELPLWSAPFGLKLLNAIKLKKNIKVLDIGSGLGFPLIEIAMRLGETCEAYGIDPWKAARERTEQKIKTVGLKNIKIIDAVAENIPFEDEEFDLIVSNNGINNVQDFEKSLSEISRVAKKNADFVFTVNLEKTMIEFYNEYKNVLAEKGMKEEIINLDKHIHQKRKPINEIRENVEQVGFNTIEVSLDKFYLRFVDGTTMLNHFLIKLAFLESWLQILHQKEQTEIFSEVESRLNKFSEKEGELKLTVPFALFKCRKS